MTSKNKQVTCSFDYIRKLLTWGTYGLETFGALVTSKTKKIKKKSFSRVSDNTQYDMLYFSKFLFVLKLVCYLAHYAFFLQRRHGSAESTGYTDTVPVPPGHFDTPHSRALPGYPHSHHSSPPVYPFKSLLYNYIFQHLISTVLGTSKLHARCNIRILKIVRQKK